MVSRISWFRPIHYEILLFYDEHDIWISPRDLGANIDYTQGYVSRTLRQLTDAGLTEQEGQLYHLTDFGREFLANEVEASEIEALDPT